MQVVVDATQHCMDRIAKHPLEPIAAQLAMIMCPIIGSIALPRAAGNRQRRHDPLQVPLLTNRRRAENRARLSAPCIRHGSAIFRGGLPAASFLPFPPFPFSLLLISAIADAYRVDRDLIFDLVLRCPRQANRVAPITNSSCGP